MIDIPLTAAQTLDRYFLDMRCKILEVAAALDRISRGADAAKALADPRYQELLTALRLLAGGPGPASGPAAGAPQTALRAEQIQLLFSRPYEPNWMRDLPQTTPQANGKSKP